MNLERMEELRAQLVTSVKLKHKALDDMVKVESMRMKAEQDHGDAMREIARIKNAIIAHMMEEQA